MAVIYLPQNQQPALAGEALAKIIGGLTTSMDTQKRLAAIKEAVTKGAPPQDIMELAGNNPEVQKQAKDLIAQTVQQKELANQTEKLKQDTYNQQYMQGIDSQKIAIEQQSQADAEKLLPHQIQAQDASAALARATASKAPSEIAEAQARVRQADQTLQMQKDQFNTSRQVLNSLFNISPGGNTGDANQPAPISGGPIGPGPSQARPPDGTASGWVKDLTPEDRARLALAATDKNPQDKISSVIDDIQKRKTKEAAANEPNKPLPGPTLAQAVSASQYNSDIGTFLDTLPNIETGSLMGKAHAMLGPLGIDPKVLGLSDTEASNTTLAGEALDNAVRNNALSGGGFMSKQRIDLAKMTLPDFVKSKVTNLQSTFVIQSALLDSLQTAKKNFGKGYNTAALDSQIDASKQILDRINHFEYDPKSGALIDGQRLDAKIPTEGYPTLNGKGTINRDTVRRAMKLKPQLSMDQVIQLLVANGAGGKGDDIPPAPFAGGEK